MITCAFCDRIYRPEDCRDRCEGCALSAGCGRSRCPYCGYENQRPISGRGGLFGPLFRKDGKAHAASD